MWLPLSWLRVLFGRARSPGGANRHLGIRSTTGNWKHFPDADPNLSEKIERTVKLMPEYSVEIPLWGPWRELDLTAALLARLRRWQEFFDESFRWDSGWVSSTARDRWTQEAEAVEDELRREVGDRADVVVNLWPIQEV
jgi:hypothetical protein